VSTQPATWPRNTPSEIAIATRIAMLSAASRTCPLTGRTEDQDALLELLRMGTRPDRVEGRSFPQFLASAVERIRRLAETEIADPDAVEQTLTDIDACEPQDLIGYMYAHLMQLASEVYCEVLGGSLDVPLDRAVLPQAPMDYPFHVAGKALPGGSVVMLNLYVAGFDLRALALVPRILAHELVCHIGAGHAGIWKRTPVPDFRAFFSDGFMDCAAWRLLLMWLEDGALPDVTPVGHLSEAEVPYAYRRPDVFTAGQGAWSNCRRATNARLRGDPALDPGDAALWRASCEEAVIGAALRLNVCDCHIEPKDRFVHRARQPTPALETFAEIAVGQATPSDLFGDVLD
jgi:hypothetical protein